MNIKTSFKNLEIKLQQKNLIFVTNNIHDVFLVDKKGRETFDIFSKIKDIAQTLLQHDSVWYHSFSKGTKNLLESEPFTKEPLSKFLVRLKTNIEIRDDKNPRATFIIDFGDFMLDNSQAGGQGLTDILQSIASILTSQNAGYEQITTNQNQVKLIFILRDVGNVIKYVINKNVEYAEVIINKPDIAERQELFLRLASRFGVIDRDELRKRGSQTQIEAAALTDGMSNREILQLARIDMLEQEVKFKELYYLSTMRTKESIWEQYNFENDIVFPKFLKSRVFGQDYAIDLTARTLKRALKGLSGAFQGQKSSKPRGILFYCGPTGVGKTEMAKAIAEFIFKDESRLVRFDMSEFAQEHSDQRLLGAPPGYVGFDGGGELTNKVKENPNSLLLFDEIEKAHPHILDKFLQILEDGRLTSSKGELINFSETFIIFTSNIGSDVTKNMSDETKEEEVRKSFLRSVYEHFEGTNKSKGQLGRPEILNRIGRENIVPFNFIRNEAILIKMFESKMHKLNHVMESKHSSKLSWDKNVIEDIVAIIKSDPLYDKKDGARGMLELATKHVIDKLIVFLDAQRSTIDQYKKDKKMLDINIETSKSDISFKI